MVTNEIENNKLKCHRYWPSQEKPTETYGMVTVRLEEEEPHSTYIVRRFTLTVGKESQLVTHFQYTVWPDHGVPNTTSEILSFRKAVRKECPIYGPPLLVHCSAGVGRTGTFCVVDTVMARGEAMDPDFDVLSLVRSLRSARNFMVQTLVQYQFAFRAILDGLHKSISRTVRAIKKKSASVIQEAQLELDELQTDIADQLDTVVVDEKAFLTLGRKAGRGIVPDVRWSEFDAAADVSPAKAVPPALRRQSLAAAEDLWRIRGNVPMDADQHGR
jgi:protein-tyrosine phosphatase